MKNGEDKNMYKKILVTGATGFVGTNLCAYLKQQLVDAQLVKMSQDVCDLRDRTATRHFFHLLKPDCVIHLAATCGGIGANRARPATFMNNNLMMGLNVINTCLEYNIKKLIMTGTICAYPKFTPIPFKEEDMWAGYPEETNAPYGIAKKTLTELLIACNKQFGFESVNLYPTNMYGPHDNFNPESSHVIPAIILKIYQAMAKGENKIECWGTGSPTRDFLYVYDFCRAVVLALENDPGPEPINIGTNKEVSIKQITEIIAKMMNYEGELVWNPEYPDGQPRRCVDSSRAKALLGYEPTTSIERGLEKTVRWFLNNIHEIWK
jgi:nucleoside-diphosphate-sugar epimerase